MVRVHTWIQWGRRQTWHQVLMGYSDIFYFFVTPEKKSSRSILPLIRNPGAEPAVSVNLISKFGSDKFTLFFHETIDIRHYQQKQRWTK